MKTPVLTLLLLAAVPAVATAQRRVRELPPPSGVSIAGDTARIGLAVTGVDPNVRDVNIALRAPARLEMYAIDRTGQMHQMASCYLDSGTTDIRPTLTERVDNTAAHEAGSSFGHSSGGRPPPRQLSVWRYASSQEQLLIVIIEELPTTRRNCDQSGDGTLANFGLMRAAEAQYSLPTTLLRNPNSAWASFLVQP